MRHSHVALALLMAALPASVVGSVSVADASATRAQVTPIAPGHPVAIEVEQRRGGSPRLRSVDAPPGTASYAATPPIARASYFPVAVWFESVVGLADIARDKAVGINTYLELTSNSDLSLVRSSGMRAITTHSRGSDSDGYLLPDEVDMWAGPGSSAWTGNFPGQGPICDPEGSQCGYTVVSQAMEGVADNTFVWGQFGKGVTMWEADDEARGFVNGGPSGGPDGVSADNYWFTDPNICSATEGGALVGKGAALPTQTCRRGYNYGLTVDRVRSLVRPAGSRPVWVFVEVGHPFSEDDAPTITARQIRDAVWSGLIHGAQGVVYFNHNFGGTCLSQHVLRDSCGSSVRRPVGRVNKAISRRSSLLAAPFVDGVAKASGSLDVAVKLYRGQLVLMVGRKTNGDARGAVRFSCGVGSRATTSGGATVRVRDRTLRLTVPAKRSVQFLRLKQGKTCGLTG